MSDRIHAGLLAPLLISALVAGCDKPEPAPSAPGSAVVAQSSAKVSTDESAAPAKPDVAPTKPRAKAFTATEKHQLGTTPEGVGLPHGSPIPDVELKKSNGEPVALRTLLANKNAVIVFYRGGWCPYCNFQIHSLAKEHGEFEKRKVTLVAISVDRVSEASKTKTAYEVPFALLSDPELKAHEAFKVVHQVDQAEFEKLSGYGIDLERASGQTHHKIAVPAVFLVSKNGSVRWAHADPKYKVRPTAKQLLEIIDRLGFEASANEHLEIR
jgi:peroxiredoxin